MTLQLGAVGDPKQDDEGEEANESFWLQIMAECEANYPNRLPASKSLLLLGDNDAQKTQLIAKLQGATGEKAQRRGNGLEYYFLTVRDEYCENQTKLDIWVLDDDTSFKRLLKYVVNENTLKDTTVVLMATMTKPWDIFRSMCSWIDILQKHIDSLNIPKEVLDEQKSKVLRHYQEYAEPTMSIYGNLDEQYNNSEIEINLGIEIMVVVTQTEFMSTLQNEFGYIDEHFDFIQLSLRKFCLTYGAALFYVSVKEDRNCDILLKYILHKIYSFPFRIPAMFLEKDSIFVPAGWDTENKILALAESLATITFSSPYEEVIVEPGRLADVNRALVEVMAQNDQDFLLTLQSALLRQPPEQSEYNRDSSGSGTASSARNPSRRVTRSPQKKQLEAKIASGEGDTVLQSFFKSLLKRQTSAPGERPMDVQHRNKAYDPNSHFDRSTSLENTSTTNGKPNFGSRSLGSSVDSSTVAQNSREVAESLEAVDELKPSGDCSNGRVRDEKTTETEAEPFNVFMKKYEAQMDPKKQNSTEEEEEDIRQLPEYFMSSQNSGPCPEDCCYKEGSRNGNCNEDLDMPLDRVKSKFNPPLRLLLDSNKPLTQKKEKTSPKCATIKQSSSAFGHSSPESS
ncbi:hypothetical protein JTE90_010560 [Oedothorax gibbosus]|uniref:Dynein light intermediate chain n=1 Tax=Oedothorax gibbosus TaxID=931172 RepID=A0AAV6UFE7_9ARAC|nr:hypothetical protein JTE90_010560 [Oedothorax gibbosus]